MLIPLSPPPGLNSDDTTFAAAGRWADGNNVRFRDGVARTIGGWLEYTDFNTTTQGHVRTMFAFRRSGDTALAYGTSVGNLADPARACSSAQESVAQTIGPPPISRTPYHIGHSAHGARI